MNYSTDISPLYKFCSARKLFKRTGYKMNFHQIDCPSGSNFWGMSVINYDNLKSRYFSQGVVNGLGVADPGGPFHAVDYN